LSSEGVGDLKDPLRILLMDPWLVECDGCGRVFKHFFNDDEVRSLEMYGYTYVDMQG
jgi:hypothetical protein